MWIIIYGDRNYGGTKIWGFFFRNSDIQYEISEIQYENMGIPRISYHINMSRKVFRLFVYLESIDFL